MDTGGAIAFIWLWAVIFLLIVLLQGPNHTGQVKACRTYTAPAGTYTHCKWISDPHKK